MAYIDVAYLESLLSPAQLDKIKTYGLNPALSGSGKIDAAISGACSTVDGFLEPAGYTVPLAGAPELIRRIVGFRAIYDLFMLNGIPIPQELKEEVGVGESLLLKINQGKVTLPGKKQDTDTGTGGHTFSFVAGATTNPARLSRAALSGTFF